MTVNHDAVAALPVAGSASKTLIRNVLVARMPYVLADSEDSRNLVATDPASGAIIVDLLLLGRVFHYDPTDTTTAHDGTSCLVSSDGRRYKLALGTDVFAYAVLDNTVATPPLSPALGDSYLVATGATDAWAGKSGLIAVKTNRGWEFVSFSIGRFIYVESVDTYYHRNSGGAWVTGFGNQITMPNSVPLSAAINFGKRLIVENQTTTAPPGSPVVGTAYVIGPSATGAWAGLDGKIAICEVAGSFVVYTPTNGWAAYDKALNNEYIFNGSAWSSAAGAVAGHAHVFDPSDAGTSLGAGGYTYSIGVAPTTVNACHIYIVTIPYTAKAAGALLKLSVTAGAGFSATGATATIGILRDSVSTALDWQFIASGTLANALIHADFFTTAPDALPHTYKFAAWNDSSGSAGVSSVNRLHFSLEEYAQ